MTNEMNNNAGAVQELPAKENKRKESRAVISAKAQTILDFLRNCKPYEADSIRVMVGYAVGTGDVESINETDMLSVNRFLNNGLTKDDATSADKIVRHRQTSVQKLLESVKEFVNIDQFFRVSVALMKISSDNTAVENVRQHLQAKTVQEVNK